MSLESFAIRLARLKGRLAEVEQRIGNYPHWGAALTALSEERKGIEKELERARAEFMAHMVLTA